MRLMVTFMVGGLTDADDACRMLIPMTSQVVEPGQGGCRWHGFR